MERNTSRYFAVISFIAVDSDGLFFREVEFEMLEKLSDPPAKWWDSTCDKSLLIGVYKHGKLSSCVSK